MLSDSHAQDVILLNHKTFASDTLVGFFEASFSMLSEWVSRLSLRQCNVSYRLPEAD